MKIAKVTPRLFHVPLDEVLVDAKHGDHTHFELVTATVTLSDGSSGTGYTYTGGKGGQAIRAMIAHDLAPFLEGQDAEGVEALYEAMQWHVHYVARGGIASFAISAVDIALWDLRGQARGQSLVQMAGGMSDRCRAYCGGIDLGFDTPKLVRACEGYVADGFDGVKIKVGRADDVARVAAVREAIGPDVVFAVDANYALDVPTAIGRARAFAPHDILWFEEPIIPDNYKGYAEISEATGMPLAMGKTCTRSMNLNTRQSNPSSAICSLMPLIVGGSQAGCRWPSCAERMTCRSVRTGCRNCMSAWYPLNQMRDCLRCIPFQLTATRSGPWWWKITWRWPPMIRVLECGLTGNASRHLRCEHAQQLSMVR